MSKEYDYEELGFKCGIEIHQQLGTDTKLFCGCANETVEDQSAAAKVTRRLRPVASELGDVDRAAKYEYLKNKDFVYNIYHDVSCLVELDEAPPHPVNPDALETALEAALLMDCDVPDEIHFMRKTVIDGSNTAGFQRTAIIGLDGELETSEGPVAIMDMELEEESAGIHTREADKGVFDLDRLGIPLIEVGTDASIKNPSHAKAVAEQIGMLLRSTGKVKRGLGTIRQDVNVSIADGARVEIKGFQDIHNLDTLVENEVARQANLVALQDELADLDGTMSSDVEDVTRLFDDSENEIIRHIIDEGGVVVAFKLRGLEGLMATTLCSDLHLGKELANYAKSQGANGMMHTDEDVSTYGLEDEFDAVSDALDKQSGEVVCIIAESPETAGNAAEIVCERADRLPAEVPEETRIAEMDFTTRYARPLPGSARMYPETDIPPIVMTDEELDALREDLPEPLDVKEDRFADVVGAELAAQIIGSSRISLFENAVDELDIQPKLVANVITNVLGDLQSRYGVDVDQLTDEQVSDTLQLLEDGDITKNQVADILKQAAEDPDASIEDIAADLDATDEDEIRKVVQNVIKEKQELIEEQGEHAKGALMGLVMQRLENADGAMVNQILDDALEDELEG